MKSYFSINLMLATFLITGCAAKDDSNPAKSNETSPTAVLDTIDVEDPLIFRETQLPRYVKSISGLSGVESFGRWSEEKIVTIQLNELLPEKFTLVIKAGAYGKNRKSPAVIHIGTQERKLLIDALNTEPKDFSVDFTGVENASYIAIEVPSPTSPKSIGQGEDIRTLGYNFVTLSIHPSE